jgi:hypothetical protein
MSSSYYDFRSFDEKETMRAIAEVLDSEYYSDFLIGRKKLGYSRGTQAIQFTDLLGGMIYEVTTEDLLDRRGRFWECFKKPNTKSMKITPPRVIETYFIDWAEIDAQNAQPKGEDREYYDEYEEESYEKYAN